MKNEKNDLHDNFHLKMEKAVKLADIFEIVKAAVWKSEMRSRGGLMLGLANLGNHPRGFIGAFYPVGSNVIVMNKIPLQRITETKKELFKPYAFHVLLHEYIHSLGHLDETFVRQKVYEITLDVFGENHIATQMAKDTSRFFQNLVYPDIAWKGNDAKIEIVEGFDRSSADYFT